MTQPESYPTPLDRLQALGLDETDDDDWILDEVPRALGRIGAPAIPIVMRYLAEDEHPVWSRIAAGTALTHIAQTSPDTGADCVNAITDQLRRFETQDPDLNSFLVSDLLDLRAVESAPVIEQAFAADRIDISINGDWEDVQVELGLLRARLTPPRRYQASRFELPPLEPPGPAARSHATRERRAANKRRRKIAKQSKRRNRRRRRRAAQSLPTSAATVSGGATLHRG